MLDFLSSNFFIGLVFLVIIVPLYAKLGLLDLIWKRKNGNGNKVEKRLEEIEDNHLHTIESKIDNLKLGQEKTNELLLEIVLIVRNLKDERKN